MTSAAFSNAAAHITPEKVREVLLDMIDIRSPTGHEAGMADYIVRRLGRAGLDAFAQPVEEGRPNAVAHLRGTGEGMNLLFTGHMDTSYSGDEEHLAGEGFKPKGVYRDGWVWGLGANNMKGGLAGLVVALEAIKEAGLELKGDITLGAVVGEIEKSPAEEFQGRDYSGYGIGSRHLVAHGVTADYAILAEPTSLRICTANMGCLWTRMRVGGSVAHSALSNKPGTVNAINVARLLCDEIDAWAAQFSAANDFMGERAHVTLAGMRGGAPWRLSRNPHECGVYLDIRTVPGQGAESVKRQLRALLRDFAARQGVPEPTLDFFITDPPLLIDEGLPVVDALGKAQIMVMGDRPPSFLRRPGSDAVHLTSYGVPCVQFGPGGRLHPDAKGQSMHAVGDHVLLEDVVTASRIYLAAALDVCGRPAVT
jgi:acetylornithine deacetylase